MKTKQIETKIDELIRSSSYTPSKLQGILNQAGLNGSHRKTVRRHLKQLTDSGRLRLDDEKRFIPSSHKKAPAQTVKGRLSLHPQGFGFLAVEGEELFKHDALVEELFIPTAKRNVARHGDRVMAELIPDPSPRRGSGGNDLPVGQVLEVIERASAICVGTLKHSGGNWQLIPDNARIQGPVRITGFSEQNPRPGFKAVAELEDRMDPAQPESGKVMEILGQAGDPGVDILSIMRTYDLVSEFPDEVMAEALAYTRAVSKAELSRRRDLRDLTVVTIDPEDARDFDDALSIEPVSGKEGWWRVGIHIADVAHFVKSGSALDREALQRGTSAYLVDRVVPMLPEHLTNDLCSLVPNQDRLAHTVLLDINPHGAVKAVDSFESVIHSDQRLTYEQAQVLISGGKAEGVPEEIRDRILALARLTRKLRKARLREHALAFEMPEIRCVLDENGNVTGFSKKVGMEANHLVEECMLMANREVGALLAARYGTAIYRIHEEPSEADFQEMADQLRQLGVEGIPVSRETLNEIISRQMPEPLRQAVNLTLLKNMNRALYSPELGEHFGLAFDTYTHFTSPIRRYPDLIAHRLLIALEEEKSKPVDDAELHDLCIHCSDRERAAAEAEQETHRVKMFQYYDEKFKAGEKGPLPGTVSSVIFKGVLVELDESGQRGLVPFTAFQGDYFEVNSTGTRANGKHTGQVIQIGDSIEVKLARVDIENRQLDFTL